VQVLIILFGSSSIALSFLFNGMLNTSYVQVEFVHHEHMHKSRGKTSCQTMRNHLFALCPIQTCLPITPGVCAHRFRVISDWRDSPGVARAKERPRQHHRAAHGARFLQTSLHQLQSSA
jgi:hypothetical protein